MSIFINCLRKMTQPSKKNDQLKGYKVTNVDRTRRFGVACKNLDELKRKACAKFDIATEEQDNVGIFLIDGSEIDEEYFGTLEPQTTLIVRKPGETLLSDADILYNTLREVNLEFLNTGDAVSKFLSQNLKSKIAVLNKALNKNNSKTSLSSREEHPEWFKNLDTTANTKEAYMHRRCQDRIRCYLYKTIDQIKSSEVYLKNEISRRHLTNVISFFKLQLREDHCLGFYFDRSYAKCGYKGREEIAGSVLRNLKEADESDGGFNCPYDHCPCKINIGKNSYNKTGGKILDKYFTNYETSVFDYRDPVDAELPPADELDAKKIQLSSPAKKIRLCKSSIDASSQENCPYRVEGIDNKLCLPLCDIDGEFYCHGVWNADRCAYGERHCINPYRSYEELVLFSTWNFDHRIERSRTLIPNLIKVSEKDTISQNDVRYFYDNIFTVKNLRLVHIICHDKGAHN